MIGIRTVNDTKEGTLRLFDNSNLTGTFTRVLIELQSLGLSKELNAGTTPTASSFLSPNSLQYVEFSTRLDEVITIDYTLLSQIEPTSLSYVVGDNFVVKPGIFNMLMDTPFIYIGKLYTINKEKSTADRLYLTAPIEFESTVYKAYFVEKCVTTLYNIPQRLKTLTFDFDMCCDCSDGKVLDKAYKYLEALKVQQDCNDCDKQRLILDKLKGVLNVC